jgi:hypothetical protein
VIHLAGVSLVVLASPVDTPDSGTLKVSYYNTLWDSAGQTKPQSIWHAEVARADSPLTQSHQVGVSLLQPLIRRYQLDTLLEIKQIPRKKISCLPSQGNWSPHTGQSALHPLMLDPAQALA